MSSVEFDLTALLLELRRARDDDHADDEDETTDSELARTPSERREFIEDLCLELTDGDVTLASGSLIIDQDDTDCGRGRHWSTIGAVQEPGSSVS